MSKWILRIQSSLWQYALRFSSSMFVCVSVMYESLKRKRFMQIIIAIFNLCHSLFDKHHFRSMCVVPFIIFLPFWVLLLIFPIVCRSFVAWFGCSCLIQEQQQQRHHHQCGECDFFSSSSQFSFAFWFAHFAVSSIQTELDSQRQNEMAKGILTSQKEF